MMSCCQDVALGITGCAGVSMEVLLEELFWHRALIELASMFHLCIAARKGLGHDECCAGVCVPCMQYPKRIGL